MVYYEMNGDMRGVSRDNDLVFCAPIFITDTGDIQNTVEQFAIGDTCTLTQGKSADSVDFFEVSQDCVAQNGGTCTWSIEQMIGTLMPPLPWRGTGKA